MKKKPKQIVKPVPRVQQKSESRNQSPYCTRSMKRKSDISSSQTSTYKSPRLQEKTQLYSQESKHSNESPSLQEKTQLNSQESKNSSESPGLKEKTSLYSRESKKSTESSSLQEKSQLNSQESKQSSQSPINDGTTEQLNNALPLRDEVTNECLICFSRHGNELRLLVHLILFHFKGSTISKPLFILQGAILEHFQTKKISS